MRKLYPYLLPTLAILVIGFLTFRWYQARTERTGDIAPIGEGVEIENLTEEEATRIMRGSDDLKTVSLQGTGEVSGDVRYEVADERVRFSVNAELPKLNDGTYQVRLREIDGDQMSRSFTLTYGKAGYFGSGAVPAELLPFEIQVSKQGSDEVLLRGTVNSD